MITGAAGSVSSGISTISTVPPIKAWIINQPQDIRANPHQDIQFSMAAAGTGPFTFTWRKNGDPIPNFAPGSNSPSYSSSFAIQDVSPADQGTYDVTISGAGGSVTSLPAKLTLNYARLVNLSARARIGTGENALFAGFVVANHAPKNDRWTILARAAGPSLKSLGVNQPLADPVLDLYQSIGGQQVSEPPRDARRSIQMISTEHHRGLYHHGGD